MHFIEFIVCTCNKYMPFSFSCNEDWCFSVMYYCSTVIFRPSGGARGVAVLSCLLCGHSLTDLPQPFQPV